MVKKIGVAGTDRAKAKRKPKVGRWLMKRSDGTTWVSSGLYPRSEFDGFASKVVRLATEKEIEKYERD